MQVPGHAVVSRRDIHLALRRPLLDYCDGIVPAVERAWDGKRFTSEAGVSRVRDSLAPSTRELNGHMLIRGMLTLRGLYVITWYGPTNAGLEVADTADEILALYPPGTSFVTADGNAVQVRADTPPEAGEVRPIDSFAVVTITVPYQCETLAEPTTQAA